MNPFLSVLRLISAFFCWLGGYSLAVLTRCQPIMTTKAAGLGVTLLLPASIWSSGAWATAQIMKAGTEASLIAATCSGALVILMDRAMLVSMASHRRSILGICFRLLLAVLGSIVFAHPALIMLSGGIIDQEIDRNRQTDLAAVEAQYSPQLIAAKAPLAQAITALADSEKDAAAIVTRIQAELTTTQSRLDHWREEADKEGAGKRTGGPGYGERWKAIMRDQIQPLEKQVESLQTQLQQAQAQLIKARDAKSKAITDGSKDDPTLRAILAEWDSARARIERQQNLDLFSRFAALDRVLIARWQAGDRGPAIGYIVICGFLLLAELIPLMLKLASSSDEYHTVVAADEFHAMQIYPQISAQIVTMRMRQNAELEAKRMENRILMEQGDGFLDLATRVIQRKEEALRMAEDTLQRVPKDAPTELRGFAEAMAKRILDGFFAHADRMMAAAFPTPVPSSAPAPGPATATASPRRSAPPPSATPRTGCACGAPGCQGHGPSCSAPSANPFVL